MSYESEAKLTVMNKKIDNRIRAIIENGTKNGHRSLFVVVGPKSRDQIVILYHILSKAQVRANPSILWCSEKKAEFSKFVCFVFSI